MSKKILFGTEARQKIAQGVDLLANTVKATLGPCGRNVVIEKAYGSPVITKDGVSVAKEITLKDPFENMGAQLVSEVASKTADIAGDGTTTATVLAQSIYREGNKYVTAGCNPMDLKRGIDKAVAVVIEHIQKNSIPVKGKTEIEQIATISANSDSQIGSQIAEAMEKVGRDGVITVETAKGMESSLEVVEGMSLDRGYISPYFITNPEKNEIVMENARILLYNKKISSMKPLLPILEYAAKSNIPLLIISEDMEGEALSTLIINKMRGTLQVCAIKAPGFGDRKTSLMEDIAIITNGVLISDDIGRGLESALPIDLGTVKKVIIKKDSCVLVDGAGTKKEIQERIHHIKTQIAETTSDYDKEKLQERVAKLSGGVAIIKVGAATETEMKEKKDRIDDALHATRAALEEGIVPGGGVALLKSAEAVRNVRHSSEFNYSIDIYRGVDIIMKALEEPLRIIASNGGFSSEIVIRDVMKGPNYNYGFDAKNNKYVDMIETGIIDPAKVVRCALQNAASIAGLLLTTEAMISEIPEDIKPMSGNGMGMPSMR